MNDKLQKELNNNQYCLFNDDCIEAMKKLEDNSVDSVVTDPPYIGMINEKWDRIDKQNADILFSELFKQVYRILRYGGRFICFCSENTLSYLYRHNNLLHRELLVVEKDVKKVSAGRNTSNYKQHINCTEYVFVCTKYARENTRKMLLDRKGDYTSKQINEILGVKSNGGGMWSIYTGKNKCNQVPTKEIWEKFKKVFNDLPNYETFEEVFNNTLSKGNILKNISFNFPNRKHPTQKPLILMEYLIETYTRENDNIVDPFMGSGTTGVACGNLNRKFIGIELEKDYYETAKKRIHNTYSYNKLEDND